MTPQQKDAMQMALDALVSSTGELHLRLSSPTDMQLVKNHKAIQALRTALAQPEPEPVPVAWMNQRANMFSQYERRAKNLGCTTPLYTTPQKHKENVLHNKLIVAEFNLKQVGIELLRLYKVNAELVVALLEIAEWTERYTTPGHPISIVARAAFAKAQGENND